MHWILQNNLFNEDAYGELLNTLKRFDIPHSIHKVIPFVGEITEPPQLDHSNVICMGSYSLRHATKKYGWNPGVFDLEPFDFTQQREKWGEHMLNYNSVISTFENASFAEEDMFIRPIHDSKVFAGQMMNRQDFTEWQTNVCKLKLDYGNSLSNDTLIQVVPFKKIFMEVRVWVIKGEIITASLYKQGDKVVYQPYPLDTELMNYAKARIAQWQPHDAFVIDVCYTEDGPKVVEINTINSCGFYAADIQKLVMGFEDAFNN